VKVSVEYLGFIRNMLSKRTERYGDDFKKHVYESGQKDVKYGFVVTVNGVLMDQLHGIGTPLKNGDHVILMSLMSGG